MSANKAISNPFISNKNSEELRFLLLALDASISGIIITDHQQPDNPIIFCNKAFEEISGYSRDEIIGHNCRFLQREDRNQPERNAINKAIKEGKSLKIEIRNYKKDGTLFWNELYLSPVTDAAGKVTYFIGVQNDITRRKNAEAELKQQKADMEAKIIERTRNLRDNEIFLSGIIETVRESLIVLSHDLTVLSANEHFFRTFKVSRTDTLGAKLYDLGDGQWNIKELKNLLEQILPTSNPVIDFEVDNNFPHIGKKLMLVNAYRIEHEGEYKDHILIAIEDITDRRAIEVRKDDFLSIASHELKTPLTTAKGYMQLAQRMLTNPADVKAVTALEKANISINRLEGLIAELLDVSRIQSGKLRLHKADFLFDKMVFDAVDAIQNATTSHNIAVHGKSNAIIFGDESHLIQVINNLISNAIKYSPDGKVVTLHLGKVSDYVKVSVTDSGIGVNYEDQKRIFERFYRAENIQQKFPGMGIGLYVCEQIVKSHHGTLWVESQPGKGSTFSVTLPANPA